MNDNNFWFILKDILKRIKSELLLFSVIAIIIVISVDYSKRLWICAIYILASVFYIIFEWAKLKIEKKTENIKPEITVAAIKKEHFFLLEYYNFGEEDILNFKSRVTYKNEKGEQKTIDVHRFFNENQDPKRESASECKLIRKKEKKYGSSIPSNPIDQKLYVEIEGLGAESKKQFKYNFIFFI